MLDRAVTGITVSAIVVAVIRRRGEMSFTRSAKRWRTFKSTGKGLRSRLHHCRRAAANLIIVDHERHPGVMVIFLIGSIYGGIVLLVTGDRHRGGGTHGLPWRRVFC